jgi:hypothetical protein
MEKVYNTPVEPIKDQIKQIKDFFILCRDAFRHYEVNFTHIRGVNSGYIEFRSTDGFVEQAKEIIKGVYESRFPRQKFRILVSDESTDGSDKVILITFPSKYVQINPKDLEDIENAYLEDISTMDNILNALLEEFGFQNMVGYHQRMHLISAIVMRLSYLMDADIEDIKTAIDVGFYG